MTHIETKIQTDLPLKYLSQSSPNSAGKPMIIFLHGLGSDEADLFELKNEFPQDYTFISVRAPLDFFNGYQWYQKSDMASEAIQANDVRSSTKLILEFIPAAIKKYQTDSSKVILIGFSQGGIMNYEIGLNHPEAVRGIASLSGKILPSTKVKINVQLDLKKINIFIGHGTHDDVVPFAESVTASELLGKISTTMEFHSYDRLGHSINMTELADLKNWVSRILK
ncbi:MAG: alpha/beta hydrolase [Bacteriovorax sp.]|nr:alpha/beta hydrolase [Bacteriovorax sp.]